MNELTDSEQEIIRELRNLPVAIIIIPRKDGSFIFQTLDRTGVEPSLASAIAQAVSYLTGYLAAYNPNKRP